MGEWHTCRVVLDGCRIKETRPIPLCVASRQKVPQLLVVHLDIGGLQVVHPPMLPQPLHCLQNLRQVSVVRVVKSSQLTGACLRLYRNASPHTVQ